MSELTLAGSKRVLKLCRTKWEELRHDEARSVLFLRHLDISSEVRRVVVYYTRNIICVVVRLSSKDNRFFYNNSSDLILLARLLETPSKFKDFGFKQNSETLIDVTAHLSNVYIGSSKYERFYGPERSFSFITDDDNSQELEARLKRIDSRLKYLKDYREHVKSLVSKEKKKKKDVVENGQMMRSFVTQNVLSELKAITMSQLECLTLNPDGKGVVYAEKTGQCYWTCPINWNLGDALRGTTKKHYPKTINIGSGDRYYVRFSDGKQIAKGNEEFQEIVSSDKVKMVAFGATKESYVVLYEDGGTAWSYIPRALRKALCSRTPDKPSVQYVALGPGDAYFVRFGDDSVQYGNLTNEMKKALDNCPGTIKEVTYGAGNCLIARYEPS